jgi:hypothetical protein
VLRVERASASENERSPSPTVTTLSGPSSSHGRLLMALLQAHSTGAETQLHCVAPFTAVTNPLSALTDPLVHTIHTTGGSARAGQTLGSACLIKMVNSAWEGDVRWV